MAKLSKFGAAFAAARKSGKKEFDFGGKKFHTKMKGEGASKKSSVPSKAPTPTSRASAVSGMAKKDPSFSGLSNVAKTAKDKNIPVGSRSRGGGPYFKGTIGSAKKKSENPDKIRTPGKYKLPKY